MHQLAHRYICSYGNRDPFTTCLQDGEFFREDGKPRSRSPSNWRGPNGLYCVGFTGQGLLGAGKDALRAASDIAGRWQEEMVAAAAPGAATISPV
jgi:hypothetical protein